MKKGKRKRESSGGIGGDERRVCKAVVVGCVVVTEEEQNKLLMGVVWVWRAVHALSYKYKPTATVQCSTTMVVGVHRGYMLLFSRILGILCTSHSKGHHNSSKSVSLSLSLSLSVTHTNSHWGCAV